MGWIFLLSICLAPVAHVLALHASRQGKSRINTAAFWGGIAGLLSIPTAIIAFLAYLPFSIAGAGDHPITWILPASWIALWVLTAWSVVAYFMARRHRQA
jgi:phosphatidylglycerophosphate synthase